MSGDLFTKLKKEKTVRDTPQEVKSTVDPPNYKYCIYIVSWRLISAYTKSYKGPDRKLGETKMPESL